MKVEELRSRDIDCDECDHAATVSVDLPLPGGKLDRKFLCSVHYRELKAEHHDITDIKPKAAPVASDDYLRASKGW